MEAAASATSLVGIAMSRLLVALMDTLVERGVLSTDDLREMLDRLEKEALAGEPKSPAGKLEQDATVAIIEKIRELLLSTHMPPSRPS